ncbi:MAG: hypothetical protein AUH81_09860 [Candidatus Rokubacteria bacterium 13_1_40CM_4_69_5]|nr:MAG: hypothetical protein AUH81_09860 [Candidatus Rokubacteria bacterium 13_1_40CM_4_69_5]
MIRTEETSTQIVRRSVRVDGRQVSYLTVADPTAEELILLIHGSGVSARYWTEQLRGLAKALQVLALDLPGHGESDSIADSSVEAYADVVAGFLAVLGTGPVVVAGHSLGGAVGLALAVRRERAVRGLVLLSSCAKVSRTNSWTENLLSYLPGPLRKILFFMAAKKMLFAPGASDLAVRLGMQELAACRPETILQDLRAAKAMDLTEQARGLDVPVLIMCGSRDKVTPPALSERLHGLIRRSRLDIVEGTGHMLLLEAPERVNRDILDFVGSLGAQREASLSRRFREIPMRSLLRRLLDRARVLFRCR